MFALHVIATLLGIAAVLTGAALALLSEFKEPFSLKTAPLLLAGAAAAAFGGVHYPQSLPEPAFWITGSLFQILGGSCAGYGAIIMLRGLIASFRQRRDDEALFDETNTGFVFYLGMCFAIPYMPVLVHSLSQL